MVLQAALGSLLMHQEKVGKFRAARRISVGQERSCVMGLGMLQRPCSELSPCLGVGCMVPALRDMEPFLSNPMEAYIFAIKAQLLHLERYGAPG